MATCSITTLTSDACANEFANVAQDEFLWRTIMLQLFYNAAGGAETLAQLEEQACTNGFDKVAQNEFHFRAIMLQLLCNNV